MKNVIKKATEGGWKNNSGAVNTGVLIGDDLIDIDFWKSLGLSCVWGTEMVMIDEAGHPKEWCYFEHCPVCGEIVVGELEECPNECKTDDAPIPSWHYQMRNFIDHIAVGGSIDDFFNKLLK